MWDGTAMVVADGHRVLAFSPGTTAWTTMPAAPFDVTTLTWNGQTLIAFNGDTGALATLRPGGRWERQPNGPFTHHADGSTAQWAAGRFVVWGGLNFDYSPASTPPRPGLGGAAWDPSTDKWTPLVAPPGIGTGPLDEIVGGVAAGDQLVSWGIARRAAGPTELVAATWTPH